MAGAVVVGALLAACTPVSETVIVGESIVETSPAEAAPDTVVSDAEVSDLVGADGTALAFPTVDLAAVTPSTRTPEVLTEVRSPSDGTSVHVLAVAEGGDALVARAPEDAFDGDRLVADVEVGTLAADGTFTPFAGIDDDVDRQALAGDLRDGWATWVETASTQIDAVDWQVLEQGPDGGDVRVVATSDPDVSGLPAGGDPEPVLSDGRVWWHAPGGTGSQMFSAELGGGPVEAVAGGLVRPAPVEGGVAALHLSDASPDGALADGVVVADAAGTVDPLATLADGATDDRSVRDVAAAGDLVALSLGAEVYVLRTDGTPVVRFLLPADRTAAGVAVCGDRVVFSPVGIAEGESDSLVVHDVASGETVSVSTPGSLGRSWCSDGVLAWSQVDLDGSVTTLSRW